MKKIVITAILFLVTIVNSVEPITAEGCWAYLSPEQLIQNADVILVGYIEGKSGVYRSNDILDTEWKVHVNYYFKGKERGQYLTVHSPGAKGSRVGRSTDYSLDEWGRRVLLFLKKKDNRYYPLSPQGVVSLKSNNYTAGVTDPSSGSTVLKQFILADPKLNKADKTKLEQLISPMAAKKPDSNINESGNHRNVKNENSLLIVYLIVFILVVPATFYFVNRFRRSI